MRLLVDTNVLIPLVDEHLELLHRSIREQVTHPEATVFASIASLWEIAIKSRIGKLRLKTALVKLPQLLHDMEISLLVINHHHVLAAVDPEPATRDPFDRLLLAQCTVEDLRLVTLDRALAAHPLAWRAD